MRLEVPFVPDAAYQALLAARGASLEAVYFRLGPDSPDCRLPDWGEVSPQDLTDGLRAMAGVPRLGLLNAAFHSAACLDGGGLRDLILLLKGYLAAGAITGIVYADHYLLVALSDAAPDVARELTAVPSINFRLDCFERVAAVLDAIADTRFAPPEAIVLDRDVNRDTARLRALRERIARAYPGLRLGLVANEGCLYACPFKTSHDAHIALSQLAASPIGPDLNRNIGCLRAFDAHPWRLLASPFVRPEDTSRLEGVADFLKICGHSRPAADLSAIVAAYLAGAYAGNLPWLMDAQERLANAVWLENGDLPGDFFARTDGCSRQCRDCGYCRELAGRLVTRLEPALARRAAC